jgi:hypothetical protein
MEGNQYWKRRASHGRPRKFATAEALWQAASAYFEWCDNTPLTRKDYKGWAAKQVNIPLTRPYTLSGFSLFNNIGINYLKQLKASLAPEEQELYFTITRIEKIIWVQQFEGACVGVFNPLIIGRSLNTRNTSHQVQKSY